MIYGIKTVREPRPIGTLVELAIEPARLLDDLPLQRRNLLAECLLGLVAPRCRQLQRLLQQVVPRPDRQWRETEFLSILFLRLGRLWRDGEHKLVGAAVI